jgi:hypothetical protein
VASRHRRAHGSGGAWPDGMLVPERTRRALAAADARAGRTARRNACGWGWRRARRRHTASPSRATHGSSMRPTYGCWRHPALDTAGSEASPGPRPTPRGRGPRLGPAVRPRSPRGPAASRERAVEMRGDRASSLGTCEVIARFSHFGVPPWRPGLCEPL